MRDTPTTKSDTKMAAFFLTQLLLVFGLAVTIVVLLVGAVALIAMCETSETMGDKLSFLSVTE